MLIQRTEYLNKLIAYKDTHIIKVITGIRRCGKSTLMEIYQKYLLDHGVSEDQIVAINFEDYDFADLKDDKALYSYLKKRFEKSRKTYIFLDEVQQVSNFPKIMDSLFIKKNVDLYVTGSNAYMLSSDLATYIAGRYVQIAMMPLSFKEYTEGTGNDQNLPQKFAEYLENSSFPYTLELAGHPNEIHDYLDALLNTIIVKDIMYKNNFSDPMMLKSVMRFLFDNVGNQLSSKKIADTMTSDGRTIDTKTVEKYISAFTESYVMYQAKRYNIKGKQYLKTLNKYYAVDIGLRYTLLGSHSADTGHILKNVIYLELLRRGYDVYTGKIDTLEVDFVAMNQKEIIYYQVSATVRDPHTLARELASLQQIHDHYPKFILTLDEDPETDYDGIRRINALDWLIGKTK